MSVQISVDLGSRSYPIHIDKGGAARFPAYLKERFGNRGCAVVTNDTVANIYSSYIDTLKSEFNCAVHALPDGERYKTVGHWSGILDTLVSARLDRGSYVIAFGGGVVGDMAGFAAACFMRGIDYVQMPTTLLAMVDSSVGGKTAVDHTLGKNLIGAFHQPAAVFIDTDFLATLPRRQFICGYAEAFKYAFIGGRGMFDFINKNKDAILRAEAGVLSECVERSIRIKADVVRRDEREAGERALLNYGHTFAHALERYYGFEGLEHGEAVLWGCVCAFELAKAAGALPEQYFEDFTRILEGAPLPPLPSPPNVGEIYEAMMSDKKSAAGVLRFVLPKAPGEAAVIGGAGEAVVKSVLERVLR